MKIDTIKSETLLVDRIIKAPVKGHVRLLANHFGRYGIAADRLEISRKDCVIDASCGIGYGSYLLSLKAKKVFGLDVNELYLNSATKIFKTKNLNFYTYRFFDELLFKNKVFKADKIVCIETFEHIPKTEADSFVCRLLSYLEDGGDMFLTAPLGNNKPCNYNRFHLNNPSIGYLRSAFGPLFKKVYFEAGTFKNSFGHNSTYCRALLWDYKGEKHG